jgi:hypothetical protein
LRFFDLLKTQRFFDLPVLAAWSTRGAVRIKHRTHFPCSRTGQFEIETSA